MVGQSPGRGCDADYCEVDGEEAKGRFPDVGGVVLANGAVGGACHLWCEEEVVLALVVIYVV